VKELQDKFVSARQVLDGMDGAELSPEMQEEVHDLYQKRLTYLNTMMANYSRLPLFENAQAAPSKPP